ncbi:hypothetical protein SUDANB60_04829 [Streptomyces sp. enrichment culture]
MVSVRFPRQALGKRLLYDEGGSVAHHNLRRSAIALSAWTVVAALCILGVGVASVAISGWMVSGVERANDDLPSAAERSALGDYFGGVNAVFSGLALLLLVTALFFQQRELRSQREELALQRQELVASREELRRSAEATLRGLHVQLTEMAMADPSLAEVWNDLPRMPADTLRQYLFANLAFSHYVLMHSWGACFGRRVTGTRKQPATKSRLPPVLGGCAVAQDQPADGQFRGAGIPNIRAGDDRLGLKQSPPPTSAKPPVCRPSP